MRHLLCLLILMTPAAELSSIYAQHSSIRARAVASYNARGTMVRVYRMSDPEEVSGCERFILAGRVVSVEYDDRSGIVKFSLKDRNSESRKVNLPKSLYKQLPSEAEMALPKLLSRGKRVRVVAYGCDVSVGVLEADEIRAL